MNEISVLFGIAFCLLSFNSAVCLESSWNEWSEQLQKDVSHDTYLNLLMLSENKNTKINNETLETFEQILNAFDNDFVQKRYDDVLLNTRRDDGSNRPNTSFYKWEHYNHWFSDWPTMYICLTHTSLARGAIASLRKYYHIRTLYTYDYEYEVGYIISDVIFHYTSLLELMNMIHNRYIKFKFRRLTTLKDEADLAPVRYMWYIYRQMADLARKIIFTVDLLYELKDKHRNNLLEKGHLSPFIFVPLDAAENKTFRQSIRMMWYNQMMAKKGKRKGKFNINFGPEIFGSGEIGIKTSAEERKRYKKMIKQAQKLRHEGIATKAPIKRGSKKNSFHDFHYGWSIEESWAYMPPRKMGFFEMIFNTILSWFG